MRWIAILSAVLGLAACSGPDVEHGKRLARVMGCVSCHGDKLDGHLVSDDLQMGVLWSSNLSRIVPQWSDAQVEAVLRTGKRPDGSALWFMPTFAHQRLSKDDMRDLIGWLRTVPASGALHPRLKRGPQFARALAQGLQDAAAEAARLAPRTSAVAGAGVARGRYLASIACAECHGPDLNGPRDPQPGDAPDLRIAASYSRAEFERLMRDGIAQNGQPVGLMTEEARKRLSALTAEEVDALHAYLVARARR